MPKYLIFFTLLAISTSSFALVSIKPYRAFTVRPDLAAYEYRLQNGLSVVLVPNKKAPLVEVYHWVKAGSLHETPGITGIAHLFEHMMFRPLGSGKSGFFALANEIGASVNANTRFEGTLYTSTVPNDKLKELLKLEGDRFKHLTVTDELLKIEREAVRSEYSTSRDSNPIVELWDLIYKAGFPGHPFEWHIIGFFDDLDKISAKDCNGFFNEYYKPNNVGLFISGDFDKKEILEVVNTNYSDWKKGVKESKLPHAYSRKTEYIVKEGRLPSTSKTILTGFRVPYINEDTSSIYDFINFVFFDSSYNLAKKRLLYDKNLVADFSSFNPSYDNGMLKSMYVPLSGVTVDACINDVLKLKEDFKSLDDKEYSAYLSEFKTYISETSLRNSNLIEMLAISWGKYNRIDYLELVNKKNFKIKRERVNKYLDEYYKRDNLVVVVTKEEQL